MRLYRATKGLCAGGVGGEREVQPGDEMLLYASALRRARWQPQRTGRRRSLLTQLASLPLLSLPSRDTRESNRLRLSSVFEARKVLKS